jgi:putative nucleotidyltransferase with HDIG domain
MKSTQHLPTIAVKDLRLGMYVHLDVSWIYHPFAVSHFLLKTQDQIETIKKLSASHVHWDPRLSEHDKQTRQDINNSPALVPPSSSHFAPEVVSTGVAPLAESVAAYKQKMAALEQRHKHALQLYENLHHQAYSEPAKAYKAAHRFCEELVDQIRQCQQPQICLLGEHKGDKLSIHALNVTIISLLMGRHFGWEEKELMDLALGALMHDIGKSILPSRVHHYDPTFSHDNRVWYENHVQQGVEIAQKMAAPAGCIEIIQQHHEMQDRSGFPARCGGDSMSAASRVVALVNCFDNLCNPAYSGAKVMTPHEALGVIFSQKGHRFDPTILGSMIKMMGVYPAGSLVQLTDNRYALVVGVKTANTLRPEVLIHDPHCPRQLAVPIELEKREELGIWRSLKPQALPPDVLAYLGPRRKVAYFVNTDEPESMAA